jgi:hypothetical protein
MPPARRAGRVQITARACRDSYHARGVTAELQMPEDRTPKDAWRYGGMWPARFVPGVARNNGVARLHIRAAVTKAIVSAEDVSSTAIVVTRPRRENRQTHSKDAQSSAPAMSCAQLRVIIGACCIDSSSGLAPPILH